MADDNSFKKVWVKVKEVLVRTHKGRAHLALVTTGGQKVLIESPEKGTIESPEKDTVGGLFASDDNLFKKREAVDSWMKQGSSVWCVFDLTGEEAVSIVIEDQDFKPEPVIAVIATPGTI